MRSPALALALCIISSATTTLAQTVVTVRVGTGDCGVSPNTAITAPLGGSTGSGSGSENGGNGGSGIPVTNTEIPASLTSSNAAAPSSSSPPVSEFLVGFQTAPNSRVRKLRRDTGITSGFITPAGTVTSNCTQSDVCYINSQGQLSLVSGAIYSTNTGVASEPFVPSNSPGTISTTWQLSGTVVKWNHVGFLNGTAALCLDPTSGTVQVYFTSPPPTSCISVILTSVSLSSCSGLPPSATSVPPTLATGTTTGSTLSPSTSNVVFGTTTTYAGTNSAISQGSSGSIPTATISQGSSASTPTTAISQASSGSTLIIAASQSSPGSTVPTTAVTPVLSGPTTPAGTPNTVTIATVITTGNLLYTTTLSSANTVEVEVVQPTPVYSTIYTGSVLATTTVTGAGGEPTIEYLDPIQYVTGTPLTQGLVPTTETLGNPPTETLVVVVPTGTLCPPTSATAFTQYYTGVGYTLNSASLGSNDPTDYTTPISTTYSASTGRAIANQLCSCSAYQNGFPSYVIYYSNSNGTWTCVIYSRPNSNTAYFSVANSDATVVAGYSQPLGTLSSSNPQPKCAQYYSGVGYDQVPNPGANSSIANATAGTPNPITTYYQNGGYTALQLLDSCATDTYSVSFQSYDLHFNISANSWFCIAYSYFNPGPSEDPQETTEVADSNVGQAYGCNVEFY